nr:MAG TPA: hypothetical protein [Caudoviricetes sp.]
MVIARVIDNTTISTVTSTISKIIPVVRCYSGRQRLACGSKHTSREGVEGWLPPSQPVDKRGL